MDISGIQGRKKRVSLSGYFGDDDYIVIKYIPREKWKLINKLTLKSDDTLLYSKYQEMFGSYEKSELDIEKMTPKQKSDYIDTKNKNFMKASQLIPENELLEAQKISEKINRMLVEFGLDQDDHSLISNGKKVKLDFTVVESLGSVKGNNESDLYLWIINEIRSYNSGYDLGE